MIDRGAARNGERSGGFDGAQPGRCNSDLAEQASQGRMLGLRVLAPVRGMGDELAHRHASLLDDAVFPAHEGRVPVGDRRDNV